MDEQTSAAGDVNATASQSTGSGAQANQPDYKALFEQSQKEAETWKSRFTGLQGKYQQEQSRWTADSGQLLDLQTKFSEITGLREQLELHNKTLAEQLEAAATEKEILSSNLERVTIVTTEFPTLVPFLNDGLIPDDSGDALREKLKTLKSRIDTIKTASTDEIVSNLAAGSSPATGSPAPASSAPSELLKQAFEAMRKGDYAAYNDLYSRYLESTQGG